MKYVDVNDVRKKASDYYRNGDFYCSEAIVKTIRDTFDLSFEDNVIKLASGFPIGIGGSGCACGAIAGGIMAIGMVFGRSTAKSSEVNIAMSISGRLHDYFKEKYGSTCCRVLTRGMTIGAPEHIDQCAIITGEIAAETARLINDELSNKSYKE